MRSEFVQSFRSRLAAVHQRSAEASGIPLPFDAALAAGRLHEWFVDYRGMGRTSDGGDVPLCFYADVALRALASGVWRRLAWVGFDALPNPSHLGVSACRASILIDLAATRDPGERLWVIDVLARSPIPVIVFARVERLTLAHTRRLQLAAASGRSVCMVARPAKERQSLSAAATRWCVEPVVSPSARPRWIVTRLRNKDRSAHQLRDERGAWLVELGGGSSLVHLPAVAGDGSASAVRAAS